MKKILFVLIALCFVSSLAFAEEAGTVAAATDTTAAVAATTPAVTTESITLKGDVIDNTCVNANKDNLAAFVKTHTKQCTLLPGCMESGYSIFADGKPYKFDKDSNPKIVEFLKKADSKLQVSVTAKQVGDELNLVSIENQN